MNHLCNELVHWKSNGSVTKPRLVGTAPRRKSMHALAKYFEKGLTIAANAAWQIFSELNTIRPNKSFTPQWSDKPLLKSYQKTRPTLGWPRRTDSLCPGCVKDARQNILDAIDQGTFEFDN